jgi:hypothetical protein
MNNEQLEGRFWSKVKKTTDCWLWIGSKGTRGYGQFWNGIKTVRAHRFVWEVTNGLIPEGLYVCQLEMCRLYRFAPCGHPYFLTGTELHRYFRKRFDAVGGFTPEISKAIG